MQVLLQGAPLPVRFHRHCVVRQTHEHVAVHACCSLLHSPLASVTNMVAYYIDRATELTCLILSLPRHTSMQVLLHCAPLLVCLHRNRVVRQAHERVSVHVTFRKPFLQLAYGRTLSILKPTE